MINSVDGYVAPKLTVYGSMVRLTAGGLLGSCENGTKNSNCSPAGGGEVNNMQKKA